MGEVTFFGLVVEDPPPVIESLLSRVVVGATLKGATYSSRNWEAARAASEVSPVIVIVRFLGFKQDLSGLAGVSGVATRNTEGWGVLDCGMAGRGDAGHKVLGRFGFGFGDKTSPPSISGNETLGIFGVGG
ncbi:hypothetical protein PILCRDRAFT_821911 [Piloderma croceum F 1598]|uniref:Uncharacterized protein n=1 Tax=Piloderma croceum (strain F 1598) TaxID=765440 RepID=A0A0C3B4D2_PILCF|nr:hypothetical protein PILCRDRAFT_821911 [Piloderma croceum F 1598]